MAIIKYALRKFRVMTSINNFSRFPYCDHSELLGELQLLNPLSISELNNVVSFCSPQTLPLKPVSSLKSPAWWLKSISFSCLFSSSLQWLYLDDVYFCLGFTAVIYLLSVISGDNKNDRGRAESHFLLRSVPCFLRHNYRSYWSVTPCCWCLFHCPLESHQPKAQQLQKAASKLSAHEDIDNWIISSA